MANKAISELPEALNVNNQDLFVLEQGGLAKKLPAETFITEQGIIDALAEALDGHGGISSVTLSSVSGRIRTYLITFTDGSATTFQVLDGTSIDRIVKTSTAGLTDTYTVFMSDGTTTFFTVTNGADGTVSEAMLNDALKNKAPAITETTESSAIANFLDGADDMPMHNILAEIKPVQDLTYGDPYPAGGGKNKYDAYTKETGQALNISDGGAYSNANWEVSDYIPMSEGYVTLSWDSATNFFQSQMCCYDANKTFIADGGFSTSEYGYSYTFAAVAGTAYVRFAWSFVVSGTTYPRTNVRVNVGSSDLGYSPYSNICPISGWTECKVTRTGKNLLDVESRTITTNWSEQSDSTIYPEECTVTKNNDVVSATATGAWSKIRLYNSAQYFKHGNTYTISAYFDNPSGNRVGIGYLKLGISTSQWTTSNTVRTSGKVSFSFTYDDSWGDIGISFIVNNTASPTNTIVTVSEMMIELGSTASAYESYIAPTTASLSWQTEAGTVYGGTIDVATGLLTVTRKTLTADGTQTITSSSSNRFFIYVPDAKVVNASTQTTYAGVVCDRLPSKTWASLVSADIGCSPVWGQGVAFKSPDITTAADWNTYFTNNPTQFSYELATPQTYQLTPQEVLKTLLGTNNVWADTGNVTVKYPADTKMFIEKLTMPTEDDLVANQAITSGQYFMVGNSLYLALANIASGAQITIGTNAQRVSLADALNTINS